MKFKVKVLMNNGITYITIVNNFHSRDEVLKAYKELINDNEMMSISTKFGAEMFRTKNIDSVNIELEDIN